LTSFEEVMAFFQNSFLKMTQKRPKKSKKSTKKKSVAPFFGPHGSTHPTSQKGTKTRFLALSASQESFVIGPDRF